MDAVTVPVEPVCFSPTAEGVRGYLTSARTKWDAAGWSRDLCDLAEQVLAEALNNIAEHAHAEKGEDGETWVSTATSGQAVTITVRDNGLSMPGLKVPNPALPDIAGDVANLPEGGFGWYMIHALSKDVRYDRTDGWNVLAITLEAPS